MTESRSGFSSSARARATSSTTVVGRNAPASSCASVVRRASNSGAGRGVAALEGGLGMILANVRGRLRAQDLLLVALALARGDAARRARYERLLLEAGPHGLLDEPPPLDALVPPRTPLGPSPAPFAYVGRRHPPPAARGADPPHRRRDLPLSGRHGGGPHGARRRRGTGFPASRASRQLQPLARRAVSGLHRRPALPQGRARPAVLR